jgi:hypothetical protein
MKDEREMVPLDVAKQAVASVSRRVALLHLSYAKTLIEELGMEKGLELIAKAIREYGVRIGEKTREEVLSRGLQPTPENFSIGESYRLPPFGMHDKIEIVEVNNEQRMRVYGCMLARVWREYGEERIGRFYCYMDVAKFMGYNPNYKQIHVRTIPDGDPYCELVVRPTTEEDRRMFLTAKNWFLIDK